MEPSIVYKKLVMVGDLNAAGNLYGGQMMKWVDEAASIFTIELLAKGVHFVTLKISEAIFKHPARLGDLLTFSARLCHIGRTSLGVRVQVNSRDHEIVSCDVTFVVVDASGRPLAHGLRPPPEGCRGCE